MPKLAHEKEAMEEIRRLKAEGLTYRAIREKTGRSQTFISKALKEQTGGKTGSSDGTATDARHEDGELNRHEAARSGRQEDGTSNRTEEGAGFRVAGAKPAPKKAPPKREDPPPAAQPWWLQGGDVIF